MCVCSRLQLFSKRYERTLAARTEAAKEWEAKELQLEKWAKHRYMPQFRRLHELLETKLDQLLQVRAFSFIEFFP